ncbi:phosphotransferase [Paenibacillus sp. M1]|uniref:Phosphotransferase n=1 Tax=Paenibacillus haidiansis TaxID=1574488 RepID=A0ABU7VQ22_9BACL
MNLKDLDPNIKEKWDYYLAELNSMGRTKDTYGIIHGDLHNQNLIYDEGDLTFIDFGDSENGWFAYDIAISIYHASQSIKETEERGKFANLFCQSFVDGYSKVNPVNEIINKIDYFINFRHLYSYVYHNQYLDTANLNKKQLDYLEEMKRTLIYQNSYFGISLVSQEGI